MLFVSGKKYKELEDAYDKLILKFDEVNEDYYSAKIEAANNYRDYKDAVTDKTVIEDKFNKLTEQNKDIVSKYHSVCGKLSAATKTINKLKKQIKELEEKGNV